MFNPSREEVAQHIRFKAQSWELRQDVADAMLALLDAGAEPDYRALYLAVVRRPLAPIAYHTAPREFRASILADGLRMARPADGYWNINAAGQPTAVYLAPQPDEIGKWATTEAWDVWQVRTEGLTWQHDPINEGCWAVTEHISADRLTIWERP